MRTPALVLLLVALCEGAASAQTPQYIIYLHGRSMNAWPPAALLGSPTTTVAVNPSYNGSSRIADPTTRSAIRNAISTHCRSTTCAIACYSAGCARALLALDDLRAAGTPATGLLWTEATASAAGGAETAEISTNGTIRLLAKVFLTNPGPDAEVVDQDLTRNSMRGVYGFMQNSATAPIYHLAGNKNICIKTKLAWYVSSGIGWVGSLIGGPVGFVIQVAGFFLGSKSFKLCGNSVMPGGYGDGVVPVHSAAGYADTGAHANHNDGAAKYLLRAYEQVPLFPVDHRGAFGPLVQFGSLRLAVPKNATCPNMPTVDIPDNASIVYQDADSSVAEETTPLYLLQVCGNDVWNGEPTRYATCLGIMGCCSNFSTYNTGPCTCGETLCSQSTRGRLSWFTGDNCSGLEYSASGTGGAAPTLWDTWDGNGMVGSAIVSVQVHSVRNSGGACQATTKRMIYQGCQDYFPIATTVSARRVYRTNISQYAANPSGESTWPGYVVATQSSNLRCP